MPKRRSKTNDEVRYYCRRRAVDPRDRNPGQGRKLHHELPPDARRWIDLLHQLLLSHDPGEVIPSPGISGYLVIRDKMAYM